MSNELQPPLVLTVDDDPDLAAIIGLHVRRWGYGSAHAVSAGEMRSFLRHRLPDAILLDVMLGDADGRTLVAEIKEQWPDLPVIMITRSTSVEAAVGCMQRGAADYITKPLDFSRLQRALADCLEAGRVLRQSRSSAALATPGTSAGGTGSAEHGLIGDSPEMQRVRQLIDHLAPTQVSVLILGETGTGKELVARAIHRASSRRDGPFVAVNAAALPRELVESSLFGHEKGAFTGAHQSHVGYCEQADGGSLFLDEIGDMGIDAQAKLLRFLQDHEVQRVGARRSRSVNVRVLAATHQNPERAIADGRLRSDLYYRLRVVRLELPPLAQRQGDVLLLANHFLSRFNRRHGRRFQSLSADAQQVLLRHDWPGNVRELENVIEEAVVLNQGELLNAEKLPSLQARPPALAGAAAAGLGAQPAGLDERQAAERQALEQALQRASGQPEAAAAELGISRATIYRRIKKHGLTR